MPHNYTVIYQYENPRNNHQSEFDDLKKARDDIEWVKNTPDRPGTPRPLTVTLRCDGQIIDRYQWPKASVLTTVDAYFDFPRGLSPTSKIARNAFKAMFEQWVVEIRRGMDLSLAATMVGGSNFWNMLDMDMLYPRTIKAELVKNLSYGSDTVFVQFHVRNPPTKTGRTRGDNIWFSC